jgi:hypothetical protein
MIRQRKTNRAIPLCGAEGRLAFAEDRNAKRGHAPNV